MDRALDAIRNGDAGLNSVARTHGVPKATLKRHLDGGNKYANGSTKLSGRPQTLPPELETTLVKYILDMESMLIGLSRMDLMELAYQLAEVNGIAGFKKEKLSASTMWYRNFMKRHSELSLRKAEATSVARAKGFNRVNVGEFFDSLETVIDKYNIGPSNVYNVDESGITTVQKPGNVIGRRGKKQVGSLTSGERGFTTTVVCSMNAVGDYIPPMMIYKRKRLHQNMLIGAAPGTVFERSDSGWMTRELFLSWIKHFQGHVHWSPEKPGLLILDGHYSHTRNLEAIDFARENGIILISLPPHTTHRLQPLDRTFYKSLMVNYDRACDKWLRTEKRTATVDVIARLFGNAYIATATMSTAINGFRHTGIWPCDRHIFTNEDYAATSRFVDQATTAQPAPPPLAGLPATEHVPLPATQHVQVPVTQDAQVPSSQYAAQVPANQPAQVRPSQHVQVPVNEHDQVPASEHAQVPANQHVQVPVNQVAQVPASQHVQVPVSQHAQVPANQHVHVPVTQVAQVPVSRNAQVPASQHAQVPASQHAQDPVHQSAPTPGDHASSVITVCADGRCFFRSVVVSLDEALQTAVRDPLGNLTKPMSRIVETNEADSLRAKVVSHMCEHFNEYSHIDRHIVNADVPNNKRYKTQWRRESRRYHIKRRWLARLRC